ncbi:helix-turn-helix domain-containing protein [Hyphobacterium sp. HN65]|uniref:Helix-turn-helix domain-containing protein n=1 Tax=Hyphobacterium lacteum TaxID=3116575 RepID=A0ABU7LQ56_9PROT|nr:helix-turn-helix domain-containing protein [Hyphobacterium sp. HN65]MEE2526035.1 helix-turn-helix domain-containing protein [Hyphobacterium sp. HN65]
MKYNQFCPVSKAAEIVGERWSLLILRELLMGGRRFSELQRGLGFISPALLTTRLKQFEGHGLVVRRQIKGGRGYEYFPTPACEQLLPVIIALGEWGLCWARENVSEDFDPEMLLLYLERSIDPKNLPGNSTIIRFEFRDLDRQNLWWIVVEGHKVDVCLNDPGREVDVWFTTTLKAMSDVWMGDRTYKDARAAGDLDVQGLPALTRNISSWLTPSVFAASPRAA